MIKELIAKHNWNLPSACPACGTDLEINPNHTRVYCPNESCPSRISGKIFKWSNVMGIKELGLTTIEAIQERNMFLRISELYMFDKYDDVRMSCALGKVWENIKKEIETHKETTLAKFIAGYNIDGIGEKQVQKIIDAKGYTSLEDFVGTDDSRFVCDGIGSILSFKLSDGIKSNIDDMRETIKYLTIKSEEKKEGKLSGLSFCFTGAMTMKRSELQKMVEENGGTNFDSVKKGLSYLVMADPNSTSTKAKKAREQGTAMITPEQFLEMVK